MSAHAFPAISPISTAAPAAPRPGRILYMPARRRPTQEQGRALEMLGHAIDYVVDQQLTAPDRTSALNDQDAIRLLSWCSREVFAGCPEIGSVSNRLKRWFTGRLLRFAN